MAYLSLYRKYRPQTFEEILGQDHVSNTLANAVRDDRVAHAYLFTGPRGTGKTSTARILAKALNCERGPTPQPCGVCDSCRAITEGSSLDVIEMDAASHSKVDETRDILAGVALATAGGRKKVYVIDEVHMLSTGSFNALLKTLEEPPSHVIFILATTEAHKVLQTIISRTQRFDFRPVPTETIETHLAEVAKSEGIDADPDALAMIARHAEGGVRDALSILDQLAGLGEHISLDTAEELLGLRSEAALVAIFDAIAEADAGGVFTGLHRLVSQGADPRRLAYDALGHVRDLLLLRAAPDADHLLDVSGEESAVLRAQAERLSPDTIMRSMDLLSKAVIEMRNAPNHRLLLEIALVRAASPDTDPSATGLLGRIERLERRAGIAAREPEAPVPAPARAPEKPPGTSDSPTPATEVAAPRSAAPRSPRRKRPEEAVQPDADASLPATEPAAPAPAPAEVGLSHVRDAWDATMRELGKRSMRIRGLLNPSRPRRFDADRLVVEVQSEFHQQSMGEPKNNEVLQEALHSTLGIRPPVAFVARGSDDKPSPEPEETAVDLDSSTVADPADHDAIELVKKGLAAEVVEKIAPGGPGAEGRR